MSWLHFTWSTWYGSACRRKNSYKRPWHFLQRRSAVSDLGQTGRGEQNPEGNLCAMWQKGLIFIWIYKQTEIQIQKSTNTLHCLPVATRLQAGWLQREKERKEAWWEKAAAGIIMLPSKKLLFSGILYIFWYTFSIGGKGSGGHYACFHKIHFFLNIHFDIHFLLVGEGSRGHNACFHKTCLSGI